MTETDTADEDLDFEAEIAEADVSHTGRVVALIGLGLVVALGLVGHLSGIGWFGYRQWLYGDGDLYLANYSLETRSVSIDGREPIELDPHTYEIASVVGGTSRIQILDGSGTELSRHAIEVSQSDAFFRVAGDDCLVASNVTSFYGSGEGRLEFLAFLRPDQRSYVPNTHNVIWPGTDFPPQLDAGEGPGIWIEKVGCNHLKHRGAMRAYLQVRLRDRMKRHQKNSSNPRRPAPDR